MFAFRDVIGNYHTWIIILLPRQQKEQPLPVCNLQLPRDLFRARSDANGESDVPFVRGSRHSVNALPPGHAEIVGVVSVV